MSRNPHMNLDNTDIFEQWLAASCDRFPTGFIADRLLREQKKAAYFEEPSRQYKSIKPTLPTLVNGILKYSGLGSVGRKNTAKLAVRHRIIDIRDLPRSFEGYRILHISDTHFNGNTKLDRSLSSAVESTEYDLCVLTGDYRFRSFGSIEKAIEGLTNLMAVVDTNVIAILGNHDSLRMVPHMELLGIKVLINERCDVSLNDQQISFVGVDDPSYYRLHDIERASGHSGVTDTDCAILLAHSPDLYQKASQLKFAAYLCGHTHGGQICLPGGVPIKTNTDAPRWAVSGEWNYQGMSGYTTVGVGTSIVEARFFCRPEIIVHELRGRA